MSRRRGRKRRVVGEREKDGEKRKERKDELTGACKRSTGHRRHTTIQPHHP